MNTYNTKQKQLISQILTDNMSKDLTCDEIADILKKNGTPVGKATLYRFLENLSQKGLVRKTVSAGTKSATFQLVDKEMCCDSHLHLKCTECGKLIHLGCDFMNGVSSHLLEHHKFKIDNSQTVILGVCENCGKGEVSNVADKL